MRLESLLIRGFMPFARLFRGVTLGVRGAAFDAGGRVFLVRHSYLPGWYLPGGGVDKGEDAGTALRRELREEGGLTLSGEPELFGVYLNRTASPRDHVVLFVCRDATSDPALVKGLEIAEAGFFPPQRLPAGTTPATLRRLAEIAGEARRSAEW